MIKKILTNSNNTYIGISQEYIYFIIQQLEIKKFCPFIIDRGELSQVNNTDIILQKIHLLLIRLNQL